MKKLIYTLLVATMVLSFAACGGKKEDGAATGKKEDTKTEEGTAEKAPEEMTFEEYDTGNFKVSVPSGWKALPQKDLFSEDKDALNPDMLIVGKGAEKDLDAYSKPAITISYSGRLGTLTVAKDFYSDVEDMEDIVTGDHTWTVFRCTSFGSKYYILFEDQGTIQYQAAVLYEVGDQKIDLNDPDVQALLASITATNQEDIQAAAEKN